MRFALDVVVTAVALWLVTLVIPGVSVMGGIGAFIWAALVFMFVNALLAPGVRLLSLPLRILTLGLLSLIVNALLFALVGWISSGIGNGLVVSGFWAAFFGAIFMAIATWIVEGTLKALGLGSALAAR